MMFPMRSQVDIKFLMLLLRTRSTQVDIINCRCLGCELSPDEHKDTSYYRRISPGRGSGQLGSPTL